MKGGRRLARIALGAAATALLLLAIGIMFLHTRLAGELVRSRVVPAVNTAIAGDLAIGGMRLTLRRIVLTDIALRTPEGEVVVSVPRVVIQYSLPALARGRLVLTAVRVEQPRVALALEGDGLNLARAIAAPAPDRQDDGGAGFFRELVVRRLELGNGSLGFADDTGHLPAVALAQLSVVASGRVGLEDRTFSADADMDARSQAPLAAPFSARIEARGARGDVSGTGHIGYGASELAGSGSLGRAGDAHVSIRSLQVAPALARALSGYPLPRALRASGELDWRRPVLSGRLNLQAGPGTLETDVRLDLGRPLAGRLDARGRDIDLSALIPRAPATRLSVRVTGQGEGRTLTDLSGELRLDIPPAPVAGRTLGPVRLHLRARDGAYSLEELRARVPGARLVASGSVTRRRVNVSGEVRVTELAAAAALAGDLAPPMAGRGRITLRLVGPTADPDLRVSGRFPQLAVAGASVRRGTLSLALSDLARPLRGRLTLAARALGIGDRRVGPLSLALTGELGHDAITARLHDLRVALGASTWRLRPPAVVSFAGGALSISGLRLESGRQRLVVALSLDQREIRGTLLLRDVSVSSLPVELVAPNLALAGAVSGTVRVIGPRRHPEGALALTLVNGRIAQVRPLTATIRAHLDGDRVAGRVTARSRASRGRLSFDLPLVWPPPPDVRVALDMKVENIALRRVLAPAGVLASGTAQATLTVSGRMGEPRLALAASARNLTVRDLPVGDVTLSLHSGPDRPTAATARLAGRSYTVSADLETPIEPVSLIDQESRPALTRAPFDLSVATTALPASLLARLAGRPVLRAGTVDATARARGPLTRLELSLDARAKRLSGPRFPATDLTVAARSSEDDGLALTLKGTRGGRSLADLTATLAAKPSELLRPAALGNRPVRVEARVGPVSLQRAGIPPLHALDPTRILRGRLAAELTLSGTLASPTLQAALALDELALDGVSLGRVRLVGRYDDHRVRVELTARTGTIGSLRLAATANLDLSYPALLGIDPGAVPVDLRLQTHAFDLRCLTGLAPELRLVAGRLDAALHLRGPLREPRLLGRLEWRDGALAVAGLGVYRDIHLLVHASEQEVRLDELRATSRGGHLRVTGGAVDRDQRWVVSARSTLRSFPVYADGQPIATIDGAVGLEGSLTSGGGTLRAKVDEAHVRLTDRQARDVQSLRPPDDMIVFRDGKPLNEVQAARLRALTGPDPTRAATDTAARAPGRPGFEVRIEVDAPRNLWVRGSDVNLELGLGPDFQVILGGETRLFGALIVRRGHVEVLSRRFDLRPDSRVVLTGPPRRPSLQVTATHEIGKVDTTVVVTLEGTPDAMEIAMRSPEHPEYGDTELLTLVATGRLPDQRLGAVATPSTTAASLLGGVLAARLQDALNRRLPLDVLEIAPGQGATSTRIEAGAYVSDDLYLAYVGRIGEDPFRRENRNEMHLEYQLTRRWSFEATYGDARQGAAELIWTKRY